MGLTQTKKGHCRGEQVFPSGSCDFEVWPKDCPGKAWSSGIAMIEIIRFNVRINKMNTALTVDHI